MVEAEGRAYVGLRARRARWEIDSPSALESLADRIGERGSAVRRDWLIRLVGVATLINGLAAVLHTLFARMPESSRLGSLLPFGVYHWSKLLTLVTGFMLIDLALRLWHRRRVAWYVALAVLTLAALAPAGQGHHPALALAPAATAVILLVLRRRFTVRSEPRSIQRGLLLVAASISAAVLRRAGILAARPARLRHPFPLAGRHSSAPCVPTRSSATPTSSPTRGTRAGSSTRWSGWVCASGAFAVFSLYRPIGRKSPSEAS